MEQRVTAHQSARPESWVTVECPVDVPGAILEAAVASEISARPGFVPPSPVVLLDCVTLWVTNLLFSEGAFGGSAPPDDGYNWDKDLLPPAEERAAAERVTAAVEDLVGTVARANVTLVAVTNEVGLGVVPEYPLARLYRDQLGWANQRLARDADGLYLLVSGYPLDVKALAAGSSPIPSPDDFSSPPKEHQ
jgi:adenosylcobinamide kinase/adenosylcobinamide-phosphate guanylyltransferase